MRKGVHDDGGCGTENRCRMYGIDSESREVAVVDVGYSFER